MGEPPRKKARRSSAPPPRRAADPAPTPRTEKIHRVRTQSDSDKCFKMSAYVTEHHKSSIYGCSFNQYKSSRTTQLLATVADRLIRVYEFPINEKIFKLLKQATLPSPIPESLYTVAWCKESNGNSEAFKIVVAGQTGRIFIVDFDRYRLVKCLTGCGGGVNDIRTNPKISTQFVVACEDYAVRIYDTRHKTPLIVCATIDGHMDNILSVDWTFDSKEIVSCGYDHKVILWDLKPQHVADHLKNANDALDRGEEPPARSPGVNQNLDLFGMRAWDPKDQACFIDSCIAEVHHLHFNAIDCIRTRHRQDNGQSIMYSKSCGRVPVAYVWRFGTINRTENVPPGQWSVSYAKFLQFDIRNGPIPFFMKFGLSNHPQFLCIGGSSGEIQIFDTFTGDLLHTVAGRGGLVRQIEFAKGDKFFATVSDGGHICRYDKVEATPPVVEEQENAPCSSAAC